MRAALALPALLLLTACGGIIPRPDGLPPPDGDRDAGAPPPSSKPPRAGDRPAPRWPERGAERPIPRAPDRPETPGDARVDPLLLPPSAAPQSAGPLAGQTAEAVIRRLGTPALDVVEGSGRRLQFRGACVLDVYFYAPAEGRAAVATHAEARDGAGADLMLGGCVDRLARAR